MRKSKEKKKDLLPGPLHESLPVFGEVLNWTQLVFQAKSDLFCPESSVLDRLVLRDAGPKPRSESPGLWMGRYNICMYCLCTGHGSDLRWYWWCLVVNVKH